MAKLHEALAVLSSVTGQFAKVSQDQTDLFTKKPHHFTKQIQTYTANTEGAQPVQEQALSLQTTVAKELDWYGQHLAKYIDTTHSIAMANTQAKASVEIDGNILLKDIPATGLLELEKQLNQFKAVVVQVPTLDPAKNFEKDDKEGQGIYRARRVETQRTAKTKTVYTLSPATDKFPAQVQLIDEDKPTGKLTKDEWSSLITPADKAALLERVETLIRAVKAARSRANEQVVTSDKIGKSITAYLLGK